MSNIAKGYIPYLSLKSLKEGDKVKLLRCTRHNPLEKYLIGVIVTIDLIDTDICIDKGICNECENGICCNNQLLLGATYECEDGGHTTGLCHWIMCDPVTNKIYR